MLSCAVVTHRERPELIDQLDDFDGLWPDFIFHDAVARESYEHTRTTFAEFNFYLLGGDGTVLACGVAVPLAWGGTSAGLPEGWDAALVQAVHDHDRGRPPTALCALGAMVARSYQRRGVSRLVIDAMKRAAGAAGCRALIAPVRPTAKASYPLTPMERYVRWTRADGQPFDPWIRTHWREGGVLDRVAPRSRGPASSFRRAGPSLYPERCSRLRSTWIRTWASTRSRTCG
jgi:hypothetical protein